MADRRDYFKAWRAANQDKIEAYKAATHERRLVYARSYWDENRAAMQISRRRSDTARHHGPHVESWFATAWEKQRGLCYLCERPLPGVDGKQVHIDHDHGCCPKGQSCQNCRRGLAHSACNTLIGMAEEDPERLRTIAANLERIHAERAGRISEESQQELFAP